MKPTPDGRGNKRGLPEIPDWKKAADPGRLRFATSHGGVIQTLDFMARRFCEPIQLKDLVKISGMSPRGLGKAFEQHVGATPGAVLRQVRLEHAKRLLTEQDLKLKEIARQCGYRSENTFCVAFQRAMGVAPKQFQRQYWLAASRRNRPGGVRLPDAGRAVPAWLVEITPAGLRNSKNSSPTCVK